MSPQTLIADMLPPQTRSRNKCSSVTRSIPRQMSARWYRTRLATRPLLTQSITTMLLFATGDVLAQQAIEKRGAADHNIARTARMAFYGGCIFGPAASTWYSFLSHRVVLANGPNGLSTILSRVALDQLVFTPINLTCFLSSMAFLESSSPRQRLGDTFWNALEKNWMVWPTVQFVNFKLVPIEHRLLFVNVVALGWNCYLSHLNSHNEASSRTEPHDPARS